MSLIPPGSSYSNASVLLGTTCFSERFTCIVGLLLFRLIGTVHRLQIGSWHPAPFILQLAKPPACNETRVGRSRDHRDSLHQLCPLGGVRAGVPVSRPEGRAVGTVCFCAVTGEPGQLTLLPHGQETSQAEACEELAGFSRIASHPGPNRPSCGSM